MTSTPPDRGKVRPSAGTAQRRERGVGILGKLVRRNAAFASDWSEDDSPSSAKQRLPDREGSFLGVSSGGFHRVAYVEWGDPQSEQVVLCVHGLSRQGRDFDRLAARLASSGMRVICIDLVGRGRSDWLTDAAEYNLPQYVSDITTLIARLNVAKLTWIGTSLGGILGIMMAGQAHSPVNRLVVNDIGPLVPWRILLRLGDAVRDAPTEFKDYAAANAFFRTSLSGFGNLADEEWDQLAGYSVAEMESGRWRRLSDPGIVYPFHAHPLFNLSIWNYWDHIQCPTLVLRGEHSDVLSEATAHEMMQRGPPARLFTFTECGHAPALMDVEQIDTVTDWLMSAQTRSRMKVALAV